MRHRNIIIALGFLSIIVPYLGVPKSFRELALVIVGAAIIGVAYLSGGGQRS